MNDKPADVTDLCSPPNSVGPKIACCWIGGWPAHYTRLLHCRVEEEVGSRFRCLYLDNRSMQPDRVYERGDLPQGSEILAARNPRDLLSALELMRPKSIILAGTHPRLLLIGLLWARIRKVDLAYVGDTNLLDVFNDGWPLRKAHFLFHWLVLRSCNTVFYIGSRNRDYYEFVAGRQFLRGKLRFMPYAALTRAVHKKPAKDKKFRILYLGRLVRVKAVERLVEALVLLKPDTLSRVRLTIAGDGEERARLEAMAIKSGLADVIAFLGAIPSDEVPVVFSDADLFVLSSEIEPWGNVVNEALSAGLAVAAPYWVGAAADLLVDGHSGFVMHDNEPLTIAATIERALQEGPERLSQMGNNGRLLVEGGGFNLRGATLALTSYVRSMQTFEGVCPVAQTGGSGD